MPRDLEAVVTKEDLDAAFREAVCLSNPKRQRTLLELLREAWDELGQVSRVEPVLRRSCLIEHVSKRAAAELSKASHHSWLCGYPSERWKYISNLNLAREFEDYTFRDEFGGSEPEGLASLIGRKVYLEFWRS